MSDDENVEILPEKKIELPEGVSLTAEGDYLLPSGDIMPFKDGFRLVKGFESVGKFQQIADKVFDNLDEIKLDYTQGIDKDALGSEEEMENYPKYYYQTIGPSEKQKKAKFRRLDKKKIQKRNYSIKEIQRLSFGDIDIDEEHIIPGYSSASNRMRKYINKLIDKEEGESNYNSQILSKSLTNEIFFGCKNSFNKKIDEYIPGDPRLDLI